MIHILHHPSPLARADEKTSAKNPFPENGCPPWKFHPVFPYLCFLRLYQVPAIPDSILPCIVTPFPRKVNINGGFFANFVIFAVFLRYFCGIFARDTGAVDLCPGCRSGVVFIHGIEAADFCPVYRQCGISARGAGAVLLLSVASGLCCFCPWHRGCGFLPGIPAVRYFCSECRNSIFLSRVPSYRLFPKSRPHISQAFLRRRTPSLIFPPDSSA